MDSAPAGAAAADALPLAAPAVVAVVVARDPGPWFEEGLRSLSEQDYPNLSILVVDAGSDPELEARVGAAAPGAYVRRAGADAGFGAAANDALDVVRGAAFYLLCHDDVALDPATVRLLVEEAFRSNAGVVGPKLVRWDDQRRLLQMGEAVDTAGYTAPLVERDELDQGQHDAVADVFSVPGACTLVRADLFAEIGGFDEGIEVLADDLSLCWRAQLAGARVLVVPRARARHVEALGQRRPESDRRRLLARHRLRVVLTCYSASSLVVLAPRIALAHAAEALVSLLLGRPGHARDIAGAWAWNLRRLGELRAARRHVRSFRLVGDREIRRRMLRGSARLSQFVRGRMRSSEGRLSGLTGTGLDFLRAARGDSVRSAIVVWVAVALVLAAGSRHLLTRGLPAVGEFAAFRDGPLELLEQFASGWREAGLGSTAPAPTALGLLGLAGGLSLGAMETLRLLLVLGLVPLGALLAYRLAGAVGTRRSQAAALAVYVANPLPYNALAAGRWGALAAYAAAPALLGQLARASGRPPFGPDGAAPGAARRVRGLWRQVLACGMLSALVATLAPAAVALVAAAALGMAAGSVLALSVKGSARVLAAGLGGSVVAVVLHLPWSLDFVLPGASLEALLGPDRGAGRFDLAELARFQTGPLGAGPIGWALLVAAALPLLIGRDWRLAWAVRAWTVAVTCWGLAWASGEGWLGVGLPVELLLAPGAAALALAAGVGVAAFETDLPRYRFGWRQAAAAVSAAALALAVVPVLGAALDGRWGMPGGDHNRALGTIDQARAEEPFRVLWVGDPTVLPLGGWGLQDGVAYATTDHGTPRVQDLWPGSDDGPTGLIAEALELASAGQTARLGRLLAPMAVRYVVVVEQLAPAPFSREAVPAPGALHDALAGQLDLQRVHVAEGLVLYENVAHAPPLAQVPGGMALPDGGLAATAGLDLSGAAPVLERADGHARWRGQVAPGEVLFSAASDEGWELRVAGRPAEREKVLGWANGFRVLEGGEATLSFRTPPERYAMVALQGALWVLVSLALLAGRSARAGSAGGAR